VLEEYPKVAQERGAEGPRRWFSDEEMDLIVWLGEDGGIKGFELCYDKSRREHAFEWRLGGTLRHFAVDGGESTPLRNDTPILVSGVKGDRERVLKAFRARSVNLEPLIADAVCAALGVA
jgi:hypothetical protein